MHQSDIRDTFPNKLDITVAMGQVLHRLKLTCIGNEGTIAQTSKTFRTLMWMTVGYYLIRWILLSAMTHYAYDENAYYALAYSYDIFRIAFSVFVFIIVARTRKKVRSRYDIPEETCGGAEDCCCAFWCTCCTIAQISRHTTDYEHYPAFCCTESGLAENAPAIEYAARGNTSETLLSPDEIV